MENKIVAMMEQKVPLPAFTIETALQKVQWAEEVLNSKDLFSDLPPER
jgi:nuclear transport factor 2 (NTF2) superfamily protein